MPIQSPNMNLPVPVPSVDSGPGWAQSEVACFSILDAHTHAPGNGVPITPTGLNINSDLSFQINNAINMKSVVFSPSTLSTLNALYVHGVDLYYNDGSGNPPIPITQGGTVNAGPGSISGLPSGTASAVYSPSTGTFVWQQATSTAANMDAGTLILRYPGSYPTSSGNYIQLRAPSSLASGITMTLPPTLPPNGTRFLTMVADGEMDNSLILDGITLELNTNIIQIKAGGVTTTQIASHTILGTNISATAGILGSQLASNAGITGGQLANLTLTNAQISGSAAIEGEKMITNANFLGKAVTVAGKNIVSSNTNATNGLAVIRGYVTNPTSPLSGFIGEGVTPSRTTTGSYTLTFSTAFADTPAVCVMVVDTGATAAYTANISAISSTSVSFQIAGTGGGGLADKPFTFIIVGQRA